MISTEAAPARRQQVQTMPRGTAITQGGSPRRRSCRGQQYGLAAAWPSTNSPPKVLVYTPRADQQPSSAVADRRTRPAAPRQRRCPARVDGSTAISLLNPPPCSAVPRAELQRMAQPTWRIGPSRRGPHGGQAGRDRAVCPRAGRGPNRLPAGPEPGVVTVSVMGCSIVAVDRRLRILARQSLRCGPRHAARSSPRPVGVPSCPICGWRASLVRDRRPRPASTCPPTIPRQHRTTRSGKDAVAGPPRLAAELAGPGGHRS